MRYVYNHFAFLSESSNTAAEASYCAAEVGKFWPYHDLLFENQGDFGKSNLVRMAGEVGIDSDAFEKCLDSGKYRQAVEDQREAGRAKGVSSTPTILVNGSKVTGAQPFEILQEMIERAAGS